MHTTPTLSLDQHRLELCRRRDLALKAEDADEVYRFVSEILSLEAEGS